MFNTEAQVSHNFDYPTIATDNKNTRNVETIVNPTETAPDRARRIWKEKQAKQQEPVVNFNKAQPERPLGAIDPELQELFSRGKVNSSVEVAQIIQRLPELWKLSEPIRQQCSFAPGVCAEGIKMRLRPLGGIRVQAPIYNTPPANRNQCDYLGNNCTSQELRQNQQNNEFQPFGVNPTNDDNQFLNWNK